MRSALRTCRRRPQIRPSRRLTSVRSSPSRAVATIEIVPVSGSRKPETVQGSLQTRSPYERLARSGTTKDACSSNVVPRSLSIETVATLTASARIVSPPTTARRAGTTKR